MKILLTLQLFALLLGSVAAAERVERDFTVWEPAIKAFERRDAESPPAQEGVLFVGSSSIRIWDLPKYFPGHPFINRGFGGSQIVDSIHFADRIILKYGSSGFSVGGIPKRLNRGNMGQCIRDPLSWKSI